jgi:multisubunit Na+/H+ antiporter MnhG subunit
MKKTLVYIIRIFFSVTMLILIIGMINLYRDSYDRLKTNGIYDFLVIGIFAFLTYRSYKLRSS